MRRNGEKGNRERKGERKGDKGRDAEDECARLMFLLTLPCTYIHPRVRVCICTYKNKNIYLRPDIVCVRICVNIIHIDNDE